MAGGNRYKETLFRVGWAYTRIGDTDDGCAYCGAPCVGIDHVPGIKTVQALGFEHFEKTKVKLVAVPCCRECNSLLSRSGLFTVKERKAYIAKKLEARYSKLLRIPKWDHEELDEIGRGLKDIIVIGSMAAENIRRRIENARS